LATGRGSRSKRGSPAPSRTSTRGNDRRCRREAGYRRLPGFRGLSRPRWGKMGALLPCLVGLTRHPKRGSCSGTRGPPTGRPARPAAGASLGGADRGGAATGRRWRATAERTTSLAMAPSSSFACLAMPAASSTHRSTRGAVRSFSPTAGRSSKGWSSRRRASGRRATESPGSMTTPCGCPVAEL
jgi:hypothetical protein